MPNNMTGDFEAVAEVSGPTLNRLAASMHQNTGGTASEPKLPHNAFVQLGGADPAQSIDGVRGSVRAQISSPRVILIHNTRERVGLEAWIRARFRPDPGSVAFPEFIYGLLHVEYVVDEIRQHARYPVALRLVVDPTAVSFTSAGPDHSWDHAITRQIVALLQTEYAMKPHPLIADCAQRKLKSLATPAESAVAYPVTLSGGALTGDPASIQSIFLAGRDFAVAVSRESILAMIQPTLDAIKSSHPKFTVTGKVLGVTVASGTYTVSISTATAAWAPGTMTVGGLTAPAGVITLHIAGSATTPSVLPNASFSIAHDLWIGFNAATESLFVIPSGPPKVSANVSGPFGGLVAGYVQNTVTSVYNAQLTPALVQAQATLQVSGTRKQAMIQQLRLVDLKADAHFDAAEFNPDGLVLRGFISVAPRRIVVMHFGPLENLSGWSAFQTWIPGGRIEKFDWRWFWFDPKTGPFGGSATPDQNQSHSDRFVLLTNVSLPGLPPVPGTTGPSWPKWGGVVCLSVRGFTVNPQTGVDDPVDSSTIYHRERICYYLYPPPPPPPSVGVLPWKPWWVTWLRNGMVRDAAAREMALIDASGSSSSAPPFNHLIHYIDSPAGLDTLAVVNEAIRSAARDDAGLLVTIVFCEGLLAQGGPEFASRLEDCFKSWEHAVIVTEDIRKGWSASYKLPVGNGGSATRLVLADARLAWEHDGAPDAGQMAAALHELLVPCDPPQLEPVEPTVRIGDPAPVFDILTGDAREGLSLDRLRGSEILLVFVQPWSTASIAQLRLLNRLQESPKRRETLIIALVSGSEYADRDGLAREHALTYPVALDPHGSIATQYGVRIWPTMISIDCDGVVSAIQSGADPTALLGLSRSGAATSA